MSKTWDGMSLAEQKAIQRPKDKLTLEQRMQRKELFWGLGWVDGCGRKHIQTAKKKGGK